MKIIFSKVILRLLCGGYNNFDYFWKNNKLLNTMIFRFIMLSDEQDDFRREFKIDAEASFLDLHNVITKSVKYDPKEMASFFMCEEDWSKNEEITLVEMDTSSEVDSYIMGTTKLSDFLEEEKQKLMYVFDYMSERAFFMELREIIYGEDIDEAQITKSVGNAPQQLLDFDEEFITKAAPIVASTTLLDDDFYGDDGYNEDELDAEGFEGLDDENISLDDIEL